MISVIVMSAFTPVASSSTSLWWQKAFQKATAEIFALRMQALFKRIWLPLKIPTVASLSSPKGREEYQTHHIYSFKTEKQASYNNSGNFHFRPRLQRKSKFDKENVGINSTLYSQTSSFSFPPPTLFGGWWCLTSWFHWTATIIPIYPFLFCAVPLLEHFYTRRFYCITSILQLHKNCHAWNTVKCCTVIYSG